MSFPRHILYALIVLVAMMICIALALRGQATFMRVQSSNGNTMVIAYDAPNQNSCTEQVSTSPGYTPLILNQTSAAGQRSRTFLVVGLTPQITYYYKTICGGVTVTGQFRMQLAVPTPGSVLLGFTAAPMPSLGVVDGIKFQWGLSPGSLTSSQSCSCNPSGCSVLIGSGSDIRQDTTYYLQWSWMNGGTVLRTSEILPLSIGYGTPFPPAIINYLSPHCLSPGSPTYLYSTPGGAIDGWNGSGSTWACGSYPTASPKSLPSAGCPTTLSFTATNQCTGGYSTPLTDPDTGNRIMRITESGSFGNNFAGSGRRFYTAAGGWATRFNVNDTQILIEAENYHYTVVGFNPSSMTLTGTSVPLPFASTAPFQRNWNFSITDPDILYYLQGNILKSFNLVSLQPISIKDLTTLPFWVSGQTPFVIWPGGQNICGLSQLGTSGSGTGKVAFCYSLNTPESWVIDTSVGTINGSPLTGGTFNGVSTIHEVTPGLDGEYLAIDTGKGFSATTGCYVNNNEPTAQYVVKLRTGEGAHLGRYCDSTHWALGHNGLMMQSAPNRPSLCTGFDNRGIAYRLFTDMNPPVFPEASACFTQLAGTAGVHLSWSNNPQGVSANQTPVLITAYDLGKGSQCHQCNELAAFSPAVVRGTATSYRFGQMWATQYIAPPGTPPVPNGCPDYENRTAQISRSGRYGLFMSDWIGGTGTGGTCGGGRRTDLFLMELK